MHKTNLANYVATIAELQDAPMKNALKGNGSPVAILEDNKPVFYCVPAKTWETLMEHLEDAELGKIAKQRAGEPTIALKIDEL